MTWTIDDLNSIGDQLNDHNPFKIAEYLGIDVVFTEKLPNTNMGLAVSELKVAFIDSEFWDKPFSYFLCAHELVHAIGHNGIQPYYNFNELAKGKIENEADNGAIKLIVNYYFEIFPNHETFRPELVLNYFDLPEYLLNKVEKEMKYIAIDRFFN